MYLNLTTYDGDVSKEFSSKVTHVIADPNCEKVGCYYTWLQTFFLGDISFLKCSQKNWYCSKFQINLHLPKIDIEVKYSMESLEFVVA